MRTMIHKIHTGEELEGDYAIGGTSFKEVRYPGDRRNCNACHVGTTYTLPLPSGLSPVTTPQGLWTPTLPAAASCISCHDGIDAGAHAFLNTATIAGKQYESCSVCHKESADFAVSVVHAR